MSRALLLTVGTGDMSRLEESLFAPLRKSIEQGEWERVVLLPSLVTEQYAAELKVRCGGDLVHVQPLPAAGLEDDADACFAHFDQAIGALRDDGFPTADIVADFTRGTKAMSAALVLAAVRHDLSTLRYIIGPRDNRGMVRSGMEQIFEISPAIATARKRLDAAFQFTRHGNFAGALALLDNDSKINGWPSALANAVPALRSVLRFYAAWDRLDYRTAAAVAYPVIASLPEWHVLWPTPAMAMWTARLAAPAALEDFPAMAARLRLLACDLHANGERRIRDRHFEDAVLRGYRVLELVGQIRLFGHGLDSGHLPPDQPAVQKLSAKLAKAGSVELGMRPDGSLTAAREQVARLLKVLGDPLASDLLKFDEQRTLLKVSARNKSVLIHGFQAVGQDDDAPLRELYRALEALLIMDGGDVTRNDLLIARQMAFSISPVSVL
ncbi:MAG: TIGR02710 family CRISPR-associated protein [Rhodospirillales bacterium]|nr:TIGR02710 family CRISPR-associated protein [Rhodospirillales bacterium]